jgi:hypothetical protein
MGFFAPGSMYSSPSAKPPIFQRMHLGEIF